ncbi:MAG TPA: multicopper oxidase domain-containing protein [Gemmatimonadaceae bacterium]|nr:multicopper oxidase domain-containing protein [Gemmatimonadaceae bacterium]
MSNSPLILRSRLSTLAIVSLGLVARPSSFTRPWAPEQVSINDNRKAAGTLKDGVLTIRLEARAGEWHPDRDTDPGVIVYAFGEQGKPPQVPGPLIRVKEGTEIHAFIRNALGVDSTLTVHGLYERGAGRATSDTIQVKPNETREVRFTAGVPGTYYYWAAPNEDSSLVRRRGPSTQLSGAIVVEPRGAPSRSERVIVMSLWADSALPQAGLPRRVRIVMNGKAWPHTERLSYVVGDTVRMRVINAGAAVHPMHLHGFYFKVDSRGNERVDTVFSATASPRLVVTERLTPGRSFSLTWVPTRPGNWVFHCHDNVHITPNRPLSDGASVAPPNHNGNHALEMMGGPVMGVHVTGRSIDPAEPSGARRKLRLVARVDSGHSETEPAYGYTLHEGSVSTPTAGSYLPGPTIVLKRGQPVSITVVNEISEPTAVHWHGIELESYFDGVAGFSGAPGKISPPIAPRDSFEARFTPPRSGTFIYHTHVDEVRQQRAGLAGALVVVDDPATHDAATDLVMLVTTPRRVAQNNVVFLNGTATPGPLEMRVGTRYRLRWINVHTFRPSMIMKIMRDSTVLTWRALAKDGMPLPSDLAVVRPSAQQMGNGETYDFEFTPTDAGNLHIDVTAGNGVLLVRRPVIVR